MSQHQLSQNHGPQPMSQYQGFPNQMGSQHHVVPPQHQILQGLISQQHQIYQYQGQVSSHQNQNISKSKSATSSGSKSKLNPTTM